MEVGGGDGVGEVAEVDGHGVVFGLRNFILERRILKVIDVEEDTPFIVVDEQSIMRPETEHLRVFLDQRVVNDGVQYFFSKEFCL